MRLPPRWLRRLLIDPATVLLVVLALISLPIWLIVAAFVSRYVPGKWRILRLGWFLFLYLAVEAVALAVMFLLWIASGLGWRLRGPGFRRAHYRLLGWILGMVVTAARRTFKLSIEREGPRASTRGDEERTRSVLVLSRHAGPGDSLLLMNGLVNGYQRDPRIVLKEFLQWDPAVDVILNRLPTSFVPVGRKGGEALIESIADLARTMSRDDAFVIFPEGGNYTAGRRARAIQKLREIGRPDLAERAEELKQTLPPRSLGVMTALAAAPASDVFFIGHAGLESFVTAADIWRAMPMDTSVAVKIWHVPAEDIPSPEQQETWLYDTWAQIDYWISSKLEKTG